MISIRPSNFCCGMFELGNFGYDKFNCSNGNTHYHRGQQSGGWEAIKNTELTTKEEILKAVNKSQASAVVCSTSEHQEYLIPILEEIGFIKVFFKSRWSNAESAVWVLAVNKVA